ncbi:hypothetical protein DPMN_061402 [Dreissena polymorpha]|uniref:MIB/HERC2 domain-containing protein n=1 Tax=Dreissena polymorpha TaxID=45954 RepID=A0A9D4HJ50_DREPO|nr:hypothetical protein DPMN_061402 [Dreissena polymorpha]
MLGIQVTLIAGPFLTQRVYIRTTWSRASIRWKLPFSANGYLVKRIFGSDLKKHIKVGTRVVRGTDWRGGDQDGGGPGTVTRLFSGQGQSG